MDHYGLLLYEDVTEETKYGLLLLFLAGLCFITPFIFHFIPFFIIAGSICLIGDLYMVIFKRSKKFQIFEHAIVFTERKEYYAIERKIISTIEFVKAPVPRKYVSNYYPIIVLNSGKKIRIFKPFNPTLNSDLTRVLKRYQKHRNL